MQEFMDGKNMESVETPYSVSAESVIPEYEARLTSVMRELMLANAAIGDLRRQNGELGSNLGQARIELEQLQSSHDQNLAISEVLRDKLRAYEELSSDSPDQEELNYQPE